MILDAMQQDDDLPMSASITLPPEDKGEGPVTPARKPKGRRSRNHIVSNRLAGPGSLKTKKKAPVAYQDDTKSMLTKQEAEFIKEVAHPVSPNFLKPHKAHQVVATEDSHAGSPSRVSRMLAKEPVAETLKELLDTPDVRSKIQRGLDTILDDMDHKIYRPREWTDALRAWAELTGNKAPDKIVAIPITPLDRQKRYDEVLAKVRNEQQMPEGRIPEVKVEPSNS